MNIDVVYNFLKSYELRHSEVLIIVGPMVCCSYYSHGMHENSVNLFLPERVENLKWND